MLAKDSFGELCSKHKIRFMIILTCHDRPRMWPIVQQPFWRLIKMIEKLPEPDHWLPLETYQRLVTHDIANCNVDQRYPLRQLPEEKAAFLSLFLL